MLAVNYSTIRENLKTYCDRVTDNNETVIVTRKGEKKRCYYQPRRVEFPSKGGSQRRVSRQIRPRHSRYKSRQGGCQEY
jgi:FMN-dependent NADH-azoreductase